jgi:hypothetical protein
MYKNSVKRGKGREKRETEKNDGETRITEGEQGRACVVVLEYG